MSAILQETTDKTDFLLARQNGIGGSDIGAILGVSPFKTPVDVFLAKTQPNPEEEHKEIFYWGHALEDPIINRFEMDHCVPVIRNVPIARHKQHDWMIANVDGIINEPDRGILEIKTVSAFGGRDWGSSDSDEAPLSYIAQVAWYMSVMDYSYAKIAALFGGNDYREFHIDRDMELEQILIDKGRDFWFNHIQSGNPPEPTSDHDLNRLFKKDNGSTVEADSAYLEMCHELKVLKEKHKKQSAEISQYETEIKTLLGEASTLLFEDQPIATWKSQSAKRLDTKALKLAHPDLYDQFCKVSETRVFRLK